MSRLGSVAVVAVMALAIASAWPAAGSSFLGEETFGNAPLPVDKAWGEGVADLVNAKTRVYRQWVNGNEDFFFDGDADALNEALDKFARTAGAHEVVLRPGPGKAHSFEGKAIDCRWRLHVSTGIYLGLAKKERKQGLKLHEVDPTLTVFVGDGGVDLDKIKLPANVTAIGLDDLKARCLSALKSDDPTTRGQGAYLLGGLQPCGADGIEALIHLIDDPNDYVKLCAAGALNECGAEAASALPRLKKDDPKRSDNVKEAFKKAAAEIEGAPGESKAARTTRERIRGFLKGRADRKA